MIDADDLHKRLNEYLNQEEFSLQRVNDFFYETNFYQKVILKRISFKKIKIILEPKKFEASWNDYIVFDDGSLAEKPDRITVPFKFKSSFSDNLLINNNLIKEIIEILKEKKITEAMIVFSPFNTLEITFNNNSSVFLPIFNMKFIFNKILQHFDGNIPSNKEIIAFYEDGFVLNEKRSAKI